jgi:hypothetical protein
VLESNTGATVVNDGVIRYNSGVPGGSPFDNQGDLSGSGFFVGNVENHGGFGGTGTVIGDVTNNGTLRPGNSLGSMTILGDYIENASLYIELGGPNANEYDSLDVYGNVSLGASSLLDLDLFGTFNEAGLTDSDSFDIIRYTGALTGQFGGVDYTGISLASGIWSLDYGYDLPDGSSSIRLAYAHTSVPEPSTMLFFGSGLGWLWFVRRRFKK